MGVALDVTSGVGGGGGGGEMSNLEQCKGECLCSNEV